MRVILEPPPINGHAVISASNSLEYILIDDMGGHGRGLEALKESLEKIPDGKSTLDYNPEFFFAGVVHRIHQLYPDLATKAVRLKPVIAAILGHVKLQRTHSFGDITVEGAIELGFFRFNQTTSHLECPFFLIYLFAHQSGDVMLAHLPMLNYNQVKGTENAPCTGLFWQTWEEFVGQFRMLKGYFYGGREVKFSELHAGAIGASDLLVQVPELRVLRQLPHILSPAQGNIMNKF